MKPAIKYFDYEGRPDLRCPYCNAWDKCLRDAKPGPWQCDECGKEFLITVEMIDWMRT